MILHLMGGGPGPHAFLPFGLLGGVAWLLVAAGAVLLIVWAVRAFPVFSRATVAPAVSSESPLDTLARRFASGEITADDYERGHDVLRGEPPQS